MTIGLEECVCLMLVPASECESSVASSDVRSNWLVKDQGPTHHTRHPSQPGSLQLVSSVERHLFVVKVNSKLNTVPGRVWAMSWSGASAGW